MKSVVPIDIISTCLIFSGVAICLGFGPSEEQSFSTMQEFVGVVFRPASVLFVLALSSLIGVLGFNLVMIEKAKSTQFNLVEAASYPVIGGASGAISGKGAFDCL